VRHHSLEAATAAVAAARKRTEAEQRELDATRTDITTVFAGVPLGESAEKRKQRLKELRKRQRLERPAFATTDDGATPAAKKAKTEKVRPTVLKRVARKNPQFPRVETVRGPLCFNHYDEAAMGDFISHDADRMAPHMRIKTFAQLQAGELPAVRLGAKGAVAADTAGPVKDAFRRMTAMAAAPHTTWSLTEARKRVKAKKSADKVEVDKKALDEKIRAANRESNVNTTFKFKSAACLLYEQRMRDEWARDHPDGPPMPLDPKQAITLEFLRDTTHIDIVPPRFLPLTREQCPLPLDRPLRAQIKHVEMMEQKSCIWDVAYESHESFRRNVDIRYHRVPYPGKKHEKDKKWGDRNRGEHARAGDDGGDFMRDVGEPNAAPDGSGAGGDEPQDEVAARAQWKEARAAASGSAVNQQPPLRWYECTDLNRWVEPTQMVGAEDFDQPRWGSSSVPSVRLGKAPVMRLTVKIAHDQVIDGAPTTRYTDGVIFGHGQRASYTMRVAERIWQDFFPDSTFDDVHKLYKRFVRCFPDHDATKTERRANVPEHYDKLDASTFQTAPTKAAAAEPTLAQKQAVLRAWTTARDTLDAMCDEVRQQLNMMLVHEIERVQQEMRQQNKPVMSDLDPYKDVLVPRVEIQLKESGMYYQFGRKSPFFKVTTFASRLVGMSRRLLERVVTYRDGSKHAGMVYRHERVPVELFECNVTLVNRFLIDLNLRGEGWLTIPASRFEVRRECEARSLQTYEIHTHTRFIRPGDHKDSRNAVTAPASRLSIDGEMIGDKGNFPSARTDEAVLICGVFHTGVGSTKRAKLLESNSENTWIFSICRKNARPIPGVTMIVVEDEWEALHVFGKIMRWLKPVWLTGYNTDNFDLPYFFTRAQVLKSPSLLFSGKYLEPVRFEQKLFQSAATQTRINTENTIPGVLCLDMFRLAQKKQFASNTLNYVSQEELGHQKEDVHHSLIPTLFHGTQEDVQRLIQYCVTDCVLPLELEDKWQAYMSNVEMARTTGVLHESLVTKGQGEKSDSLVIREWRRENLLRPVRTPDTRDDELTPEFYEALSGHEDRPVRENHEWQDIAAMDNVMEAIMDLDITRAKAGKKKEEKKKKNKKKKKKTQLVSAASGKVLGGKPKAFTAASAADREAARKKRRERQRLFEQEQSNHVVPASSLPPLHPLRQKQQQQQQQFYQLPTESSGGASSAAASSASSAASIAAAPAIALAAPVDGITISAEAAAAIAASADTTDDDEDEDEEMIVDDDESDESDYDSDDEWKDEFVDAEIATGGRKKQFQGAIVKEPLKGFYHRHAKDPRFRGCIATFDFASLYPSVLIAYNLCYTTHIRPEDVGRIPIKDRFFVPHKPRAGDPSDDIDPMADWEPWRWDPTDPRHNPADPWGTETLGSWFVRKPEPGIDNTYRRHGTLPRILIDLLSAREQSKELKKDALAAGDTDMANVYEARQLAMKITANSLYGYTGGFRMRDTCISASVTRKGRELLTVATTTVELKFTKANGYEHDAIVIYGDTDSIMVNFGEVDMAKTFALAYQAEAKLKEVFARVPPIEMPLEKIFETYLLRSKKRYAGWMCEKLGGKFKLMVKGMENVRRSTCRQVRVILDQILVYLIKEGNVDKAFAYAKQEVIRLLEGKVDIHGLVMTASLSKNEYVTPPAVHQMKVRMENEKRSEDTIPVVGNRVSFLYTAGNIHGTDKMRTKLGDMIEIPEYVFEHDIPINYNAYLEKQYRNPLCGMFKEVEDGRMDRLIEEARLEAVRPVHVSSATAKIGSFLSKKPKCINCHGTIADAPFVPFGRPPREREARYQALRAKCTRDIEDLYPTKPQQQQESVVSVRVASELTSLESSYKDGTLDRILFPEHYPAVPALCDTCKPTQRDHYLETQGEVRRLEEVSSRCWAHCQRCVHSHFQPDRCNNNDCTIYYMRKTANKELLTQQYLLERIECC